MADRIGIISEGREELALAKSERLSYRVSLLINLVVSAALYGAGFLALRTIIHGIGRLGL